MRDPVAKYYGFIFSGPDDIFMLRNYNGGYDDSEFHRAFVLMSLHSDRTGMSRSSRHFPKRWHPFSFSSYGSSSQSRPFRHG
mgnify:CR=1 FL=1